MLQAKNGVVILSFAGISEICGLYDIFYIKNLHRATFCHKEKHLLF